MCSYRLVGLSSGFVIYRPAEWWGNLGRINHSARSALDAIFGRSPAHPRLASAPAET